MKNYGRLMFEGYVPAEFFPADVCSRLTSEIDRDGFAAISEDLGVVLLNESYDRFGRMIQTI
ncbi:hypothetical protein [Lysobacter tyrosinilyticus]